MEVLQRTANRGSISTGYDIDNSVKLEPDNSEFFQRAATGSSGNLKTWTFSLWLKRTEISHACIFYSQGSYGRVRFETDDTLTFYFNSGHELSTTRKFRDTSAWYHIVLAVDTTDGTAANRLKVYVNGVQETMSGTQPSQNEEGDFGKFASVTAQLGQFVEGSYYFAGYMAEFYWIDGIQQAPTEFGEFDSDSGIWKPKAYTGSFGSEGAYLDFADSGNLGDDESGNGNDYAEQNITAADQATDTPTNNFQIFLSDGTIFNTGQDNMTFSEGGTKWSRGQTGWTTAYANMAMSKGKWYMEFENYATDGYAMYGVIPVARTTASARQNYYIGSTTDGTVAYHQGSGNINQNGGATSAATSVTGDIIGCAVDMDNNKAYWHKNGTYVNSSNPVTGSSGTTTAFGLNDEPYFFAVSTYNPGVSGKTNTGGYTAASISSAASDANGYGTFEYAPPTGYYALCTKNLAEYG